MPFGQMTPCGAPKPPFYGLAGKAAGLFFCGGVPAFCSNTGRQYDKQGTKRRTVAR